MSSEADTAPRFSENFNGKPEGGPASEEELSHRKRSDSMRSRVGHLISHVYDN